VSPTPCFACPLGHGATRTSVRYRGSVPDLSPEEAEVLRRSIAMLPPEAPSGVSRERALAILGQLVRALTELRRRDRRS